MITCRYIIPHYVCSNIPHPRHFAHENDLSNKMRNYKAATVVVMNGVANCSVWEQNIGLSQMIISYCLTICVIMDTAVVRSTRYNGV